LAGGDAPTRVALRQAFAALPLWARIWSRLRNRGWRSALVEIRRQA
jgi:hypothetical protein